MTTRPEVSLVGIQSPTYNVSNGVLNCICHNNYIQSVAKNNLLTIGDGRDLKRVLLENKPFTTNGRLNIQSSLKKINNVVFIS